MRLSVSELDAFKLLPEALARVPLRPAGHLAPQMLEKGRHILRIEGAILAVEVGPAALNVR
jgi:hypothetical protein